MATLAEFIARQIGGTTQGTPAVAAPNPYDIRTYQPGSTANAGSTPQQYTPPKTTTPRPAVSSGTPISLDVRQYNPSTNNSNSTIQQNPSSSVQPYNPNSGMSFGGQNTSQAQGGYSYTPPPLSKEQSAETAKSFGLQGIADNKFTGMTQSQANAAASELQNNLKTQISAGTSYSFNPETISGFNSKVNNLRTKVDTINNSTWESAGSKKTNVDSTIKSFTDQLAGGFNTTDEFQKALSSNPEFDKSVSEYQRMGGDVNNIMGAIQQKQQGKTATVVSYKDNPDGTTTNFLSDGTQSTGKLSQNADGTYSFNESNNGVQSLTDYLGNTTSKLDQKTMQSLIPEQKSLQAQIAFENGIVDKMKDYYFGSEEKIGLLQQQRQQAKERASLLETQAQLAKDNAKAQSDLLTQQQDAQVAEQEAEIEENSMVAKNYMTGMLAKLGALNTTGAAGEALVNLDIKYQKQKNSVRTNYNNNKLAIKVKMNETLNDLEIKKQDAILTLKENLSKSETDIVKEVFKLETDATRKSFDAVDKYLGMYRTQKDKYIKEAKDLAEANAKKTATTMSNYSFDFFKGNALSAGVPSPTIGAKVANPYLKGQGGSIPEYIQKVIGSGKTSLDTKAVLKGDKALSSYTPSDQTDIQRELTKLGISKDMIQGGKAEVPEVGALLKEAQQAITDGADKKAVKRKFLEAYPEKSSVYNEYIE
jgi:hypothetical protein